ncbi:unnamed protein product [Linum tenue]|uniref:TIR domain-containing protein n=1 Tax=Linum tenue TaxID=586396 RepID=A0AAV0NHX6_9ROSI|nr:unnamed protein product [Linum tenue]
MKIDGGGHDRDEDGDESRPAKRQRTLFSEIITRATTLLQPSRFFQRFLPRFTRSHLFYPPSPSRDIVPPSPSSSIVLPPKHDVFISFRGIDVRDNFLSHLNSFLTHQKKFAVYKDDSDLERGEEISPSLLEAIERSACYIVIFSPNYAGSPWCLDELVRILECSDRYGRRVVPVFYGGLDPSYVENQTGSYRILPKGEAVDKIRSWRAALTKAAGISGFDSRVTRPESILIGEICKAVLQALSGQMVPVSNSIVGLVGLERRINKIEHWATSGGKNLTIGVWGPGGIGKTTLAKAFYDKFSSQFEASYFLSNFSDKLSGSSQLRDDLQNDLFSALLGDENAWRISQDLKEHRLGRTRVLVVIDDVGDDIGNMRHLNELFKGRYCDLFASGSIIILTSRNQQVLKNVCHHVHEVVALGDNEALRLFCLRAFKEHHPPIEYVEWSKRAITYAQGNPLALTILGSHLYDRDQNFWGIELKALERHPNQAIERVFRRSYEGLGRVERNVFIDIACLYGRCQFNDNELKKLLDGNYVEHGGSENLIINFIDKSMLTTVFVFPDHRIVKMHGLLSDLGRRIVNENFRLDRRSWLFEAQDVYSFFKQGKGSKVTRGISWDKSSGELRTEAIHMQSDAFVKLENLRYLVIRKSETKFVLPKDGLRCLPNSLIILTWDAFPMRCLPHEFCPENLTSLSLPSSKVRKLWDDTRNMDLRNLKFLDLSRSKYLKKLPDLSTAKRLEEINLRFCFRLVELSWSIVHLPKLEVLNLEKCTSLELNAVGYYTDVNKDDNMAAIFPELKRLNLSGTSIQNQKLEELRKLKGCNEISANDQELVHFRDVIFQSKALEEICLSNCITLKELPKILVPMEALTLLILGGCTSLSRLPDSICNLGHLIWNFLLCLVQQSENYQPPFTGYPNWLRSTCLVAVNSVTYRSFLHP